MISAALGLSNAVAGQSSTSLETKAAGPKTFYADDRAGNNQVTVFSESNLEDFTGVCNRVAGQCSFDPQKVESFSGRFSVRIEDLKTGMDLRDQHMVGPDWLDAAHFPEVVVQIDTVDEVKKT
ncbi:MAG: YceI family protein, partial [Planctomycetota bacterium]